MLKEYKFIKLENFRKLCMKYNFYNVRKRKTEYFNAVDRIFLFKAESIGNIFPENIVEMARDIKEHSDTLLDILSISQAIYEAVEIILVETPIKDDYKYDEDGEEYWEDINGKRHYTRNEG